MGNSRINAIKIENATIELLLQHKGVENVISTKGIIQELAKQGFQIQIGTMHAIVGRVIKERHLPICSLNSHGYYWAKTKDDILSCVSHLQKRIESLQEHIDHLKNFIIE